MKQYKFEIEGIAPLLMDRFADAGTGKSPKTDKDYQDQALLKVYRDEKDNLAIPANAIKASIRECVSGLVKKTEGKNMRQTIKAFCFIEPEFLSIGTKTIDAIDKRIVTRGKGDKVTRVPTYRPLIKKWKATGIINLVEGLDDGIVKEALTLAGIRQGLLGFRPEFGRFVVNEFKEVKQ